MSLKPTHTSARMPSNVVETIANITLLHIYYTCKGCNTKSQLTADNTKMLGDGYRMLNNAGWLCPTCRAEREQMRLNAHGLA